MKIHVQVFGKSEKCIVVKSDSKIEDILKKISLKSDMVIPIRNGIIVPVDEKLSNGDKLKLLNVASGG